MPTDPGYRSVPTTTRRRDTRAKGTDTKGTPYTQYSSGVRIGAPHKTSNPLGTGHGGGPGTAPDHYRSLLNSLATAGLAQPPETPLEGLNGLGGNGGGGGGGGGRNVQAMADAAFNLDERPYWMMQAGIDKQRQQAAAYNPDFAGMERTFNTGLQGREQARAADVASRLQALAGFGSQLANTQGTAMRGALGDLAAQGMDPSAYINQANQIAGERTAGLANQGQYMGQLNASSANAAAGYGNAAGLIRQGAESTLANNRMGVNNQLDQQTAAIQMQAAKDRAANNQAKQAFMLKYGG